MKEMNVLPDKGRAFFYKINKLSKILGNLCNGLHFKKNQIHLVKTCCFCLVNGLK